MPDQNSGPKQVNPNIVPGAMIVAAVLIAILGTVMPKLVGLTGPEATWLPIVLYGVAAMEVVMAFFLRARLIKAQRGQGSNAAAKAVSGGPVQRQ